MDDKSMSQMDNLSKYWSMGCLVNQFCCETHFDPYFFDSFGSSNGTGLPVRISPSMLNRCQEILFNEPSRKKKHRIFCGKLGGSIHPKLGSLLFLLGIWLRIGPNNHHRICFGTFSRHRASKSRKCYMFKMFFCLKLKPSKKVFLCHVWV